jgi:polyvinyl alcohol dehydrogenase (cytochrome)
MRRFLTKLLSWGPTSHRLGSDRAALRARPNLEILEARLVLSGDWPMYNYDATGSRVNTEETLLSPSNVAGLHVLWNFPTPGIVAGTPAVINDEVLGPTIYAGDATGAFYALDRNGAPRWTDHLIGPVTASPLVTNGTVVIGDVAGFIYGLNANTGGVLWQIRPNTSQRAAIFGSATQVGANVAIGVSSSEEFGTTDPPTSRGSLILLNPTNGRVLWQTYTVAPGATGAAIWSTPSYDPVSNFIFAGTGNNYSEPTTGTSDAMIAFDATDGHVVWVNQRTALDDWHPIFHPTEAPDYDFGDSPHIYQLGGRTVVGAGQKSGFYHVFDAVTGVALNQIELEPGGTLGGLFATAAAHNGVVFANGNNSPPPMSPTDGSGDLFAIAGDASHVLWSYHTTSPNLSGVAIANGVVYFQATGDRTLYALDENTGALLAQVITRGANSGPAISNGRIYLGQGNVFGGGFASPGGIVALGLDSIGEPGGGGGGRSARGPQTQSPVELAPSDTLAAPPVAPIGPSDLGDLRLRITDQPVQAIRLTGTASAASPSNRRTADPQGPGDALGVLTQTPIIGGQQMTSGPQARDTAPPDLIIGDQLAGWVDDSFWNEKV